MPTVVDTCWGARPIDDQPYWHLVAAGGFFFNNVRVGKGALLSVSAGIEAAPAIENAHTPYSLSRMRDGGEQVFEEIRKTKYPTRPRRLKSLYVFDDYSLVERALREWFPNERKVPHECRLLLGAVIHKADTAWLNANRSNGSRTRRNTARSDDSKSTPGGSSSWSSLFSGLANVPCRITAQ